VIIAVTGAWRFEFKTAMKDVLHVTHSTSPHEHLPWINAKNVAGFFADLVLGLQRPIGCFDVIDCDLRRAANIIVLLARKPSLTRWEKRNAAQKLGKLLGQALPALKLPFMWTPTQLPYLAKSALVVASTLLLLPSAQADRFGDAVYHVIDSMHVAGVYAVDAEVRWRIRDWVGRVPVPPRVRQAATAAWVIGHHQFTRKMVEDYVDDWLKED